MTSNVLYMILVYYLFIIIRHLFHKNRKPVLGSQHLKSSYELAPKKSFYAGEGIEPVDERAMIQAEIDVYVL